jgi:NADPH:quinone reductase-like Zn-dependent oxidoreductase
LQVIEYNKHAPVHHYLAKTFGGVRFNVVIDAVGIQAIFNNCPQYLGEGKPYVTVGPRQPSFTILGMLSTIGSMATNLLLPRFLGGVPRPYVQVAAVGTLEAMQELAEMVEGGKLEVHVASSFKMTDAIEVSLCAGLTSTNSQIVGLQPSS